MNASLRLFSALLLATVLIRQVVAAPVGAPGVEDERHSFLKSGDIWEKLQQLNVAPIGSTLRDADRIIGTDREVIIGIAREMFRDPSLRKEARYSDPDVLQLAMQLGDEQLMKGLTSQLFGELIRTKNAGLAGGLGTAVAAAAQPAEIKYIAPYLFINESSEFVESAIEGDITPPDKVSFLAASMIQRVVETAEGIPYEVKLWSKRSAASGSDNRESYREIMRQWWRQNADFFQRKEYEHIRPGAEWAAKITGPDKVDAIPSATLSDHKGPLPRMDQVSHVPVVAGNVRGSASVLPYFLIAVASLAFAGVILYRFTRKSR
jgi:hypothetical protein